MEKKNNLVIILVAILFLIIGGVSTYLILSNDKESIVDKENNNDNNDIKKPIVNNDVGNQSNNAEIKIIETKNSCEDYTLSELVINGKQIDLGFKEDSNSCSWINIIDYHVIKNNEIILLETYEGIVGDVVRLYFIDYNGNVLLTSKQLNLPDDIHKIDINSNAEITIEAYNYMQSPCYYYEKDNSSVAGGIYKLNYLGNSKFSEIELVEKITMADYIKKFNLDCQTNTKQEVRTEFIDTDLVPNGYQIHLDFEDNLYVRFKDGGLITKYGENYKIASNVSDFYLIEIGQGGGNGLYFIYNDKTVGYAGIEYEVNNNEDIVIKKLDYKNIVDIRQGVSDDISPVSIPIFVEENGTIHKGNEIR